ncbi:11447_t:CDS:2 [Funneliformis caledonium]|uniref:11447_t:CDS:1 n=1 Tax=Funneliformis caledonium TaxID=1117310 RepID=A0A9N9FVL8_9GLOM|nr:11447_t:CDS:2 [Funneliformis caledonium]
MGGWGQDPDGSWNCQNDMFYLDLSNSLKTSSIVELKLEESTSLPIIVPPYMADFTATMLSSGEIVYIGGRQSTSPSDVSFTLSKMNVIYVFNTKSSSWIVINAGGDAPNSRIGHSAVLTSNNRIIVYGGTSEDPATPATPDLAILDVNQTPYQWKTPNVTKGSPPSRSFHSAAFVQNHMIIAFGNITTHTAGITNSFYILNVTNFRWSSSHIKSNQTPDATRGLQEVPSTTPLSESLFTQNMALILGASIGGLISFIILASIGVLIYKKWRIYQKIVKRNRQYVEQISSSQNSNN